MALTSLWEDRHPRSTSAEEAEVAGDWDVVVIGAGLTGITTAGLLARAGLSVLVVEAEHLGAGTTGGSTAKVSLLQGTQLSRRQAAPLGRASSSTSTPTPRRRPGCPVLRRDGVALQERRRTPIANDQPARRPDPCRARGGPRAPGCRWSGATRPPLPFATRGAVRLRRPVPARPDGAARALAADAQQHGVTLVEGARVPGSRTRPGQVVTTARHGGPDHVVVATNMPVLDRGGFFARAEPSRSYGLAFRTPCGPVDGMYLSGDTPSRSLRDLPSGDGSLLLVGGNGHTTGRVRARPSRRASTSCGPGPREHFPDAVETHAWSAQDYVPHHALPYVGPLAARPRPRVVAGGYSKWGMTNAVAAALALSSRILGGSTSPGPRPSSPGARTR